MLFLGLPLGKGDMPGRTQSLGIYFPIPALTLQENTSNNSGLVSQKAGSALPDSCQRQLPLKIAFCVRRTLALRRPHTSLTPLVYRQHREGKMKSRSCCYFPLY